MKWKALPMPEGIIKHESSNTRYGKFVIEPLERGWGITIGNALRRVMMSSLQGAAVVSIKIEGISHEFDVIEAMWGKAEINPDTGMPEYGFFKKLFKKVKKIVKKITKSKIFKVVAPIALSVFAPGFGTAIGSALGASGATAAIARRKICCHGWWLPI